MEVEDNHRVVWVCGLSGGLCAKENDCRICRLAHHEAAKKKKEVAP